MNVNLPLTINTFGLYIVFLNSQINPSHRVNRCFPYVYKTYMSIYHITRVTDHISLVSYLGLLTITLNGFFKTRFL